MPTSEENRFLLETNAVHFWHASLRSAEQADDLQWLLSPDEVERAGRFRFPQHRRRFIVARGCLRQLLAAYLGIEARDIEFGYSREAKPQLAERFSSDVCFNVSHSEDIAVFGFTRERRIGVDIECIREIDTEGIPQRFFSELEQRALSQLHGPRKVEGFFNCWTRKEAYVKAVGLGLSLPLRDFDVSLTPGEPARILATRPNGELAAQWTLASVTLKKQCAAAVVVEGPIASLEVRLFAPAAVNQPKRAR